MSSRELTMIEIKEVLRRWQAAQSLHQIARETALDRKTVRRYLGRPSSAGWPVVTASTELLRVNWHCLDPHAAMRQGDGAATLQFRGGIEVPYGRVDSENGRAEIHWTGTPAPILESPEVTGCPRGDTLGPRWRRSSTSFPAMFPRAPAVLTDPRR